MSQGYHPGFVSRSKKVGSSKGILTDYFNVVTNDPYSNGTYGPYKSYTGLDYYVHTGESIPNFHKRKRNGELLPFTLWDQTEFTGMATGSRNLVRTGNLDSLGSVCTVPWIPDIDWARGEHHVLPLIRRHGQRLVDSAAAGIYSQSWDTLTFLAELHKTITMFKRMLKNMRKYVLEDDPQGLYRAWLEGRYGWRILMYDLMDIQKVISDLDSQRTRFKQRTGESFSFSEQVQETVSDNAATITATYLDRWEVSLRGNVIADFRSPKFRFNPITTGWELITFSFVIDWVIDIGSWLESLSLLALAADYRASVGFKVTYVRYQSGMSWNFHDDPDGFGTWSGSYSQDATVNCERVFRTPYSVSKHPHILPNLDVYKIMDLVALTVTAIGGRR